MADPFLGEIRIMGFGFAPSRWALCNGQSLPINQNQALFSLLGTTFGGDGKTTFALPDLRGRAPVHVGPSFSLGKSSGSVEHTLTFSEIPPHVHSLQASASDASTSSPGGNMFGTSSNVYAGAQNLTSLTPQTVSSTGGGAEHPNMQPYLSLSFCIALQGIFPSRS